MTNALDKQVGGDHYKTGIQPFEFSLRNGHDGCIHAIIKYLTRHRRIEPTKGYETLCKAAHIALLRLELIEEIGHAPVVVTVRSLEASAYVKANGLVNSTAVAVYLADGWNERPNANHEKWAHGLAEKIEAAAKESYPHLYKKEDFQ